MAMAVTVPVVNGTVEMDGHRPQFDTYSDGRWGTPIAQMRITRPAYQDEEDYKLHDEAIIELALTRSQIHDLVDMLELYR